MNQTNEINPAEMISKNSSSEDTGETKRRTTTHQRITLPVFEKKKTIQEAKLWWRRFKQHVEMTQKLGLNRMTTDKEFIEEYREELEMKIKYIFMRTLRGGNRNDKRSERQRPKQNEHKPAVFIILTPFYSRKLHSRVEFFGKKTGTQ